MKKSLFMVAALLLGTFAFAQKSADLGASAKSAGSVNASWEWKKAPKGKIGTDVTTFSKPYEIAATSGKGAKFEVIKGATKFKTEDGVTALYHDNKGSGTIETAEKTKKCEYAITLDDAATIDLTVTGNGFGEASRFVVVKRGEEEVLLSIDHLNKENPDEVLTLANAPAGTYRVLVNGSRIVKLNVHN